MSQLTKILIILTVFLIPSYLIKFVIFSIPTNVLEILIYLTAILFFLEKPDIKWKELYENYKIYIFSVSLIFVGLILSTLINQNYREGFGIIKGWFFDPVLFFFVFINKIRGRKDIKNILITFYFSVLIVSIVAFNYFLYEHLTYDGRLQAFYGSPNYLAMFLAPSIFVGIYLLGIRVQKSIIRNFVMIASIIIIGFIIYLTHSYGAWISIIISLAIVTLITKKMNKKTALIFSSILLISFSTQFNNPKLNNFFSERSSLNSRIVIWKSSALMIKNNPIFGIGSGNFQNKYLEYQSYFPPYLEWAVPQPHNLYLAFWLESGVIGLFGFIFLVFDWIKKIVRRLKIQKNNQILAVCLGIIIYTLINGIFDTVYWKNDLSFAFWLFYSLGSIFLKVDPV